MSPKNALHAPTDNTKEFVDEARQEATLFKIDALLNAILHSARFSSIATDEQGVIQIFNVGSEHMLGYTASEMVNLRNLADIFDPMELSDRAIALQQEFGVPIAPGFEALVYKAACRMEDILELTCLRKDSSRIPMLVSVIALCNPQQHIIGYLFTSTDNRARKQTEQIKIIAEAEKERQHIEETLRAADQHYQVRFQSLDDGFCILEKLASEPGRPPDFRYIEVNAAFAVQSGVNDALGKTIRQILPDEDEDWFRIYDQVLTSGQPIRFERTLKADGRILEMHAFRIDDHTDRHIGVSFINISTRKLAEEQLRISEAFNRSIIQSSPDCIKLLDLEGNLLSILTGQQLLEMDDIHPYLHKSWIDFWHGEDRQAAQAAIEAALNGKTGKFIGYFPTLRGVPKWWDIAISPIPDATGKPLHLLAISRDITENKNIELALHARTVQFEMLINVAPLGLYLIDTDFRILQINPTALAVFENLPDLVGRDFGEILQNLWPKEKADEIIQQFRHTLETGEALFVPEQLNEGRTDTSTEYYEWQINRIPLPESGYGVVCYFRDITTRVFAQQKILESEERYRNLFNSIDEGFCVFEMIFDDNNIPVDYRFLEANPSFEKQTGLSNVVGKRMRELAPEHENHWFEIYGNVALTGESVRLVKDAQALENRWFDLYAFRLGGPGSMKVAVIFTNITERKMAENALRESMNELRTTESELRTTQAALSLEKATLADHVIKLQQTNEHLVMTTLEAQTLAEEIEQARIRMAHLAQHDALTDLPNRLLLNDRLKQAITLCRRHGKQLAVLFLDLDRFKHINDSLGHVVGDQLLQSVAKSLLSCINESDTVCRLGGDEFVILLDDLEQVEDAERIAQKILAELTAPHQIDRHELHITVSIGISVFPNDGQEAETLIKNADTAMYHAKEDGRNNYQFFEDKMNTRAVERQLVETCLRRALVRQEFELYYQPKINLQSSEIVGVEALIRWQHPQRGLLLPDQFVGIAEDSGLILPIGRWVLQEACRQAQKWIKAGLGPIIMAVNASALEFRAKDFLANVSAILEDTGLDPRCLEIELTESVLMRDAKATDAMLHALANLGVKLAVDDFGTGYSSLSYLRQFPIDTLKIDQSFVNQMTNSRDDATIVSAVISMGKSLNQLVIAEGVETAEQHAYLLTQNCDEGQGYYYGRPMSAHALTTLLQTGISINDCVT